MDISIERAMITSDYDCQERRDELMWLAEKAHQRTVIVEVGSWKGTTAIAMADNTSGSVYAVDTFRGSVREEAHQKLDQGEEDWLYKTFTRNTEGLQNLTVMRMTSLEAATYFKSIGRRFDLIFLDASHDYDSVKADILAWKPLLEEGGLLCGHDRTWEGVSKAVTELIPRAAVGVGAIWYMRR
jgi:predicted O-methyltransferase YrrM